MSAPGARPRPFSDVLLEAAARVDELDRTELARLLMRAAIRLRLVDKVALSLEHIPVAAYHLLRRLSHGPVAFAALHGREDEDLVGFLVSRDLAVLSEDGTTLAITPVGEELGSIADERSLHLPEQK
jgi:hypothetical protein